MHKRRLGAIDLLAIAVILLSAVGLILRMQILNAAEEGGEICTVVLCARSVWEETVDCVEVGEVLTLADGTEFGTVREVAAPPAVWRTLQDGVLLEGEWASGRRRDLTLTLTVQGRRDGDGFLLDGRRAVLVGEALSLYGARSAISYTVIDLILE